MSPFLEKVQVNIPFTMIYESYLEVFLTQRLNPEIGLDAAALDRFSLADFGAVADELHKRNVSITLHAPYVDLSPGSPDRKVRKTTHERFEQVLEVVPLFRPKTVVCHSGYDEKRYWAMKGLWIEKSLELWSWFATCLRGEGALLMLENVYEHGPEDMRVLFENLCDQEVGFCLDTGHQAAFGKSPLGDWVEVLGPYIGQLHLHDNSGSQDEHLPLGDGVIDFRFLFQKLAAMRKAPPVITLEPHREKDLLPSVACLEEIWPW